MHLKLYRGGLPAKKVGPAQAPNTVWLSTFTLFYGGKGQPPMHLKLYRGGGPEMAQSFS